MTRFFRFVSQHPYGVILLVGGLTALAAITSRDNTPSIRLLERLDFRFIKYIQWPPEDEVLRLFELSLVLNNSYNPCR